MDDKFDELCKLQRHAGGPNAGTPGIENATKEFSILTEQHLLNKNNNNNNIIIIIIIIILIIMVTVMMIAEKDVYI